jgi:hypothetical protein
MSDAARMVTWLGHDDQYYALDTNEKGDVERNPAPGPSFLIWNKVRFDKNVPKLLDPDEYPEALQNRAVVHMLSKMPNMSEFVLEEVGDADLEPDHHQDDDENDDEHEIETVEGHGVSYSAPKPKKPKPKAKHKR